MTYYQTLRIIRPWLDVSTSLVHIYYRETYQYPACELLPELNERSPYQYGVTLSAKVLSVKSDEICQILVLQ